MKFLHLGDLHLGKSLGEFELIDDQKYILEQILRIATEQKADAILIAGDIYDKPDPTEKAMNLLDQFLSDSAKKGIKICMISGNHDSDDRLNFGSSLFEKNGIYISSVFDGKAHRIGFSDVHGEVNVYLLPFVKASKVRHFYPEEKIENYDQAVRTVIAHCEVDTSKRNVIIAHQFVGGEGEKPSLGGSEGATVQNVGLVEIIHPSCFDAFDYAALGHIHSGQHIGREEVRYSGSPLKYSLTEAKHVKSVPVVTLGKKGEVTIEKIPLTPLRDLRHITGRLDQLLDKDNITDTNDFIYVTLTDEEIVNDAMGIFQQYYPNTVRIEYDNSHTKKIGQLDIAEITQGKSFSEMISDFYREIYGCDISEAELEMMNEVAKEVGVADETN